MAEVKDATPREMIAESGFESLELSSLIESKRNSRKVFDAKAQADLTESIKRYGVLSPLIVRPVGNAGKYEIIAGARRFRASGEAGLKEVPCRVVKVENDTALEVIVVDNLQRENVHPLEEAESFHELLDLSNGDMEGLCNTVGKKPAYVAKRLALVKLLDKGKKMYLAGKMGEGHAMLLARLQPNDQKEAIEFLENEDTSVNRLREWIESELMLEVAKAPWDKGDASLVAKAGPCTTCPKRTSVAKELFDDIKAGDRCTDGACFKLKMQAHITNLEKSLKGAGNKVYGIYESYRQKAEQGALLQGHWRELKKKTEFCERAAIGIYIDGSRAGHFIDICPVPDNCKIHGAKGLHGDNDAQRERMRKEMRAQRLDAEVRLRLFKLVYEKHGPLAIEDKMVLAEHGFGRLWFAAKVRLCKAMGIEPKISKHGHKDFETPFAEMLKDISKEATLDKVLVAISMAGDLDPKMGDPRNIDLYAKRLKIDHSAVEKEVTDSFTKKEKKLPKTKVDPKAKKGKGAKKAAKPPSERRSEPDPLEHSESDGTE
jgi:ParB family chromosome partitioning protein